MPPALLTTPAQILDCVAAAFSETRAITILDRSAKSLTIQLADDGANDTAIHAEVQPLGLTLRTNLPLLPDVPLVACLAAANAMTRHSQLLAASIDTGCRQFLFDLTLPFGRSGCLPEQITELAGACLRVRHVVPAPLLRYMRGRIGLDRLIVSLVLPGVGFDESDLSCAGFRAAEAVQSPLYSQRFSVGE